MNVTIESEITIFGVSIILGMAGGFVFDIFRALRLKTKTGLKTVAFQDILFWIIMSALFFGAVYKYNSGQLRFYIFLGAFMGLTLYLMTVSRFFIKLISLIITAILKTAVFLYKILAFPVRIIVIPLGKINKKAALILSKMKKILKKTEKRLKMY